ncbi:LysE family translocator [Agrobacterium sp. ES01]|uniref:LysE family translocator n=1 Tax=Agrobacterium sp. ES01 TaxID=3420714 RepID=UPI003D109093
MDAHLLIAFAATFFVFAASPGPDNVTIVAKTVANGPRSGIAYGLGTVAGILVYLGLAAFGLSLIASEMSLLMTGLRYLGGAYLIWMGIKLWTQKPATAEMQTEPQKNDVIQLFATGFALNLGNPKMPLFYLALLPNFVTADFGMPEYIALAMTIVAVEIVVIGTHVWMAQRAKSLLRRPSVVRKTNRVTGLFLAGAGVATIATGRAT